MFMLVFTIKSIPMRFALVSLCFLCLLACTTAPSQAENPKSTSVIAFGSCGHQTHPLPILDSVVNHQPDLFVFLGDNIYGDTEDMQLLADKYQQLAAKPSFQNLQKQLPIIATWDDHDYGWNDTGRHYPYKEASKRLFLDFFQEAVDSERRKREGIYTSYMYEKAGRKLQIILLDGRSFRDDLLAYDGSLDGQRQFFYGLDYIPHQGTDSTLLGEAQWAWLEQELRKEADVRIIGSGTQFGVSYNGYEAWANFPHEQARMLALIKKTRANGVLFITGDVHYAEISKLESAEVYPIYDITASGLSSTWHFATPNENRIEGPIMDNHFGLLTVHWEEQPIRLQAEIWDIRGNQRIEHSIPLSAISF